MSSIRLNTIEGGSLQPAEPTVGKTPGSNFGNVLTQAINQVDALQVQADVEANKVAQGGGNLHEMALSLEKADIAMRVMSKVRNKLVDAYNEVMRMTV